MLRLSLKEKVGQKIIAGFDGLMPPEYILDWLAQGQIGGVILFSRNIDSPDQLAELAQACYQAATYPTLIAIDQEGGAVSRLRRDFTESPGAMALGAGNNPQTAQNIASVLGAEMHTLGVNWNLAPVADLALNLENTSISTRSPGSNPQHVAEMVTAQVKGFQAASVAACVKHFPGLGNTMVDTHDGAAESFDDLETLRNRDFVPFQAAIDAGVASILVNHVKYPAIDPDNPAVFSSKVIEMLRHEMNFGGIIATDCLEMGAISENYSPTEAAILAASAGIDLLFFSHTQEKQQAAWMALFGAAISGRLNMDMLDESVERILHFKESYPVNAMADFHDIMTIGNPEHRKISVDAARDGIVLIDGEIHQLEMEANLGDYALIEFDPTTVSAAISAHHQTTLAAFLRKQLPEVTNLVLPPDDIRPELQQEALQLAGSVKTIILATRNAHLMPAQEYLAQQIINTANHVILLCLRNPYDAGVLTGADTVLCTCGDSRPSLEACVHALMGEFIPTGTLPVALTIAD